MGASASCCGRRSPNIPFQMLLRGSNLPWGMPTIRIIVVRSFIKEAAERGHRYLPHVFDSLNWVPSMEMAMDEVLNQE
jgi:pyruvate carboxylase